jgi:hypothetical protein
VVLLYTPVIGLITPLLAFQVTLGLKAPVPFTVAVHAVNWPPWMVVGAQVAVTPVTAPAVATVITVVPSFVVSCVDMAVMVAWLVKGTVDAVKSPLELMVPLPLAVQVTVELKLPVPETLAVHWLVPRALMVVGLQLAPTTVMVDDVELLLPPPHAGSRMRQQMAARIPRSRTPSP